MEAIIIKSIEQCELLKKSDCWKYFLVIHSFIKLEYHALLEIFNDLFFEWIISSKESIKKTWRRFKICFVTHITYIVFSTTHTKYMYCIRGNCGWYFNTIDVHFNKLGFSRVLTSFNYSLNQVCILPLYWLCFLEIYIL